MEGEKLVGGSLHIYSFSLSFFHVQEKGVELAVFKNQAISRALNLEINN